MFQIKTIRGLGELDADFKTVAHALVLPPGLAEALEQGVWVIVNRARENAWSTFNTTGRLPESIKPRRVNQFRVDIEVTHPGGAVHEFGLPNHPITARQRRFFWAKWYETGESLWKALALSATYTIPARPYVRPAIDSEGAEAARQFAYALDARISVALRGGRGR